MCELHVYKLFKNIDSAQRWPCILLKMKMKVKFQVHMYQFSLVFNGWAPSAGRSQCWFDWRETVSERWTPGTESWTAWRQKTRRNIRQRTERRRQVSVATETAGNRPRGSSVLDGSACMWYGPLSVPPVQQIE